MPGFGNLAGHPRSVTLGGIDGGSVVVSDAGARVLRLVGRSGYDFFWLNGPRSGDLFDVEPYAFGWRNYGGDRTWIAPEADLFWSDPDDVAGTYRVPEAFDPGKYAMESDDSCARLAAMFRVENRRIGGSDHISLEKLYTHFANTMG